MEMKKQGNRGLARV